MSPYFPFVSNFLFHLTYVIAFRVPLIDITDALNNFFFFFAFFWPDFPHHCQNRLGSKNRTSLTTLQRTYIPIPEVAMLILLQQNGSFMTATFSILPDILEGLKVFPIWWLIQTQASVGR